MSPSLSLVPKLRICVEVFRRVPMTGAWGEKWESGTEKGREGEGGKQEGLISKVFFKDLAPSEGTQEVVSGSQRPLVLASPGNLLEVQILRPYPLNEKPWGGASCVAFLTNPPRILKHTKV